MCATCGCSENTGATSTVFKAVPPGSVPLLLQPQAQFHAAEHHAHDPHAAGETDTGEAGNRITLEQAVLAKNDRLAEQNRHWFAEQRILAINLMSSPGAGKTTLLERTIQDLREALPISVIEGDQATAQDAERIRRAGCQAVQINTGTGCHLDAAMVAQGLRQLSPPPESLIMIENVGNLVCPALFDLGEKAKVVIVSVTEGDDKPLKYPPMFRAATLLLINKIDLLPYVDFDVDACIAHARAVNPRLPALQLSARTGDGLADWYAWIKTHLAIPERADAMP